MNPEPTQENLNRYLKLLSTHNFRFRSSDDHRFLDRGFDEEFEILELREILDADHKIYNVYNPFRSK